jgi:hypothetical protein
MQLRVGDRYSDETGEWEIVIHPYPTGGGKVVHARVRKVGEPMVIEERTLSVHERVAVQWAFYQRSASQIWVPTEGVGNRVLYRSRALVFPFLQALDHLASSARHKG